MSAIVNKKNKFSLLRHVMVDFADEESKGEMFAIKFANAESEWMFLLFDIVTNLMVALYFEWSIQTWVIIFLGSKYNQKVLGSHTCLKLGIR